MASISEQNLFICLNDDSLLLLDSQNAGPVIPVLIIRYEIRHEYG